MILFFKRTCTIPVCRDAVKYFPDKRAHFYTLLSGVSCVLPSFILRQQKNCMTENARSLCSVKVATPPCAASKFELCVKNNPPYDCNHTEDSLFYEHCSIAALFCLPQNSGTTAPE